MDYHNVATPGEIAGNPDTYPHGGGDETPRFASIAEMVKTLRPDMPARCFFPHALREAAETFLRGFPGIPHYAVKCNPAPHVLKGLFAAGIRHFDVASIGEIRSLRMLCPGAHLAFMHPIKSREAIAEAYFVHGVRDFAVDTFEEMHKILEATQAATDLSIHVRIAVPKGKIAQQDLSRKFGAEPDAAAQILRDADKVAHKVGVTFHIGSQCMDPADYTRAIECAGRVVAASGVSVDVFNVGGGFPVAYPGLEPPPLEDYFAAIQGAIKALKLPKGCQIWGEPGRALVAACETAVLRVELRKADALYLNDGAYGTLFDGRFFGLRYPAQLYRPGRKCGKALQPFRFYGPTCDGEDYVNGPFMLPADAREGDWIAVGQQGSYGKTLKTRFNGFYDEILAEIDPGAANVIKLRPRKSKSHVKEVTAQ
ncbi:MAG: type III PLP-dependent enzyme [Alphaproteobacteria bacterium]